MKLEKMAQQDAEMWLAAEMAYGEGAGNRRKLTWAQIQGKGADIDGYIDAFESAYANLDLTKFAERAIKERKNMDRAAKAGKNLRAIKSGNLNNLSTGIFVAVGVVWVAHQTGYDKKAGAEAKKLWQRAKDEYTVRKEGRKIRHLREVRYNSEDNLKDG